jgi:hypothetical protein
MTDQVSYIDVLLVLDLLILIEIIQCNVTNNGTTTFLDGVNVYSSEILLNSDEYDSAAFTESDVLQLQNSQNTNQLRSSNYAEDVHQSESLHFFSKRESIICIPFCEAGTYCVNSGPRTCSNCYIGILVWCRVA